MWFTPTRRTRKAIPAAWLAVPWLLLFFALALDSLVHDSPTMDEQNHVARGLALLRTGDPRLSLEHPPLINSLSALPLLSVPNLNVPIDDPSWSQPDGWYAFADQLFWRRGNDVTLMIFLARLPMVFLTMGLAALGYEAARRFWGGPAGWVVLACLLLDPNLIAHGRYATTDLGGTTFLLLALLSLWHLWRQDTGWGSALLIAAGALSLAFGSKLINLGFVPIFFLLAALPPLYEREWRRALPNVGRLILAGALSLLGLWLIFALEWGPFRFQGSDLPALAELNRWSGPLPTFWAGVERMFDLGQASGRPTFLLGETSVNGFRAYFPVAFSVKTPLATLLALPIALAWLLFRPAARGRALFLLIPALIYFGLMMTNSLNIGYRHLLPLLPLIYLLIAGLVSPRAAPGRRWRPFVPGGVVIALLIASLSIHPHYLSYFNVLAGGPDNGASILIDSNIDWGQDLLRLQAWMAENDVDSVKLGWFGSARPEYYGIAYDPLPGLPYNLHLFWDLPFDPAAPAPGVYAISATILWELPLQEKTAFAWFRAREPDAKIGYSIFIYDLR